MRQTWRWFGPVDKVTLTDAAQAGVEGIVTALHHVPTGAVWAPEEIAKRHHAIAAEAPSLKWEVVESLPVSEDIKTQTGDWRAHLNAWKTSLEHLAASGLKVICYNFMPVLDWTRTDLRWAARNGARAMRFDLIDFAVFDIYLLARPAAREELPAEIVAAAEKRFAETPDARKDELSRTVGAGLPGSADHYTLDELKAKIATYAEIGAERLRGHMADFLAEVTPTAERLGMRLCCHPDDPPFPLLGLPRIMSTEEDYRRLLDAVDSPANGWTLCSGSLGARPDNDIPGMINRLGDRLHFAHLRNVRRDAETTPCSFYEDEHLEGQTDMIGVIDALLAEEARRRAAGRADAEIPMRPDHGQEILDDVERGAQPGYPAIGRLKGLAEIRGVMRALQRGV